MLGQTLQRLRERGSSPAFGSKARHIISQFIESNGNAPAPIATAWVQGAAAELVAGSVCPVALPMVTQESTQKSEGDTPGELGPRAVW